jgi:hypothetical protein
MVNTRCINIDDLPLFRRLDTRQLLPGRLWFGGHDTDFLAKYLV